MKKYSRLGQSMISLMAFVTLLTACKEKEGPAKEEIAVHNEIISEATKAPKKAISAEFKKYWYAGDAEITSYELEQARYGELRDGHAVLIYVTEPFLAKEQVKADDNHDDNIPVLKLNATKNFLTGIYPYSIMTSSFYPVHDNGHALKVTFSMQEWCGHVYGQLNNRDKFEVAAHSYFESEGDQELTFEKTTLENELWNQIRIDPTGLPVGALKIIPSFEFIRLVHKELKVYDATATLSVNGAISTYEIIYPELERTLRINFNTSLPYGIEDWSESYLGGYGSEARIMTSTAKKIKTIKSPYWTKGSNKFVTLRDSLGL